MKQAQSPAPAEPRPRRCAHVAWSVGALVLALGSTLARAQDPTDLDVRFIERTPRYDYNAAKNNPAPGDPVTFHGHVKLWGTTDLPAVAYQWRIDGAVVEAGTLTNVIAGTERVVTRAWTWSEGNHRVKLTVDPDGLIDERSEANNALDDRINAIIAGFWVEQGAYDYFHTHQHRLGVGSNSWDDWIQRQMAKQNELYVGAIWPSSPQGVLDRVRIDKIVVVDDGALPLSGGIATNNPDRSDKTVDLMWGFTAQQVAGTFYSNHTSASLNNPFYVEKSLIHELGHARYLIDHYGFDVHNTAHNGGHDSVQIYEGDTYVAGSPYMPFRAFGEVLRYNQSGGVMTGPYGFRWSPYEAAALNLIAGRRACCGNYNAPGNIGVFLQDLPENNHVRFVDGLGVPRPNADVRIYRAANGPGWYGKTFDNVPDAEYTTDDEGYAHLPRNPFTGGPAIRHTYGSANGVMILRIGHSGQIWYRFVEVAEFNLEHFKGNVQDAYYTIELPGPNDDSDEDGLPDPWERRHFGNLDHEPDVDEEPDGLTNLEELGHDTDPLDDDSDDDGLLDGDEVNQHRTDPTDPDSDDDTVLDGSDHCQDTPPDTPVGPTGCPVVRADIDRDGDVDLDDFAVLQSCFTRTDPPSLALRCQAADLDRDRDVDPNDLSLLLACLSGANVPVDPDCAR